MIGKIQTFQLESPVHLLVKFHWNIQQLRIHLSQKDKAASFYPAVYAAFDASITAWQISDWVWKFNQQEDVEKLWVAEWPAQWSLIDFQAWVRTKSSDLLICKHVANSNKHFGVDRNYDAGIRVFIDWKFESFFTAGMAAGSPLVARSWKLLIDNCGDTHDILAVLERAFIFWAQHTQPSLISLLND